MIIYSQVAYKSLGSVEPLELPDFVILSGVNGSGKTQLLQGIAQENTIKVLDNNRNELLHKKYVGIQNLSPRDYSVTSSEGMRGSITTWYEAFDRNRATFTNVYEEELKGATPKPNSVDISTYKQVAKDANKYIGDLEHEDFLLHLPIEKAVPGIVNNDVFFNYHVSALFKNYQIKKYDNDVSQFRNIKYGNVRFLTDEQFIQKHGEPPWELVNKIIKEANLDYHVTVPTDQDRDSQYEFKLINNFSGAKINLTDLSGGEKVLMSLAFSVYNTQYDMDFPQVLLMDEPDSPLHPSMTKQFLKVIENVFVKEKGVKVIITTHSPSTVALASEDYLYQMNKQVPRISKVTKDKALRILTSGVPSFSVNYENRRQIFVESRYDVIYYERMYQKLSAYLEPEISLSFISSGESRTDKNGRKISNCEQVNNITCTLRDAGNKLIWGIIDWDKTNTGNDFVKVLGNGSRYSIENYLFDPILLAALLLREKVILRQDLGLIDNQNYTDFKVLGEADIQFISDFVVNKIKNTLVEEPVESMKSSVRYNNGVTIEIPVWYLQHHGHELEELILKTFPELNSIKKGKEEALKLEIINKVIDDIPEFMSVDIVEVLKSVQSV